MEIKEKKQKQYEFILFPDGTMALKHKWKANINKLVADDALRYYG